MHAAKLSMSPLASNDQPVTISYPKPHQFIPVLRWRQKWGVAWANSP